jgi:hypothetical protein
MAAAEAERLQTQLLNQEAERWRAADGQRSIILRERHGDFMGYNGDMGI